MTAAAVATVAPSAPPPGMIPDSNPAPYKKQKSGEPRSADADSDAEHAPAEYDAAYAALSSAAVSGMLRRVCS